MTTATTAYGLNLGTTEIDESLASIFVDCRMYRDVYCPELKGKYPIGRIYSEVMGDRVSYYPEVCHSHVELESCGCMEEALMAIASAIGVD